MLYLGTSSFSEPDWQNVFYPKGTDRSDYIKYYATRYRTVEIDATYYAIPSQNSIKNWVNKTDDQFIISAKFPKSITHGGKTSKPDSQVILMPDKTYEECDIFLERISHLGSRLGVLVLQFPYFSKQVFSDKQVFYERLDNFLNRFPKDFKLAVEIRNKYYLNETYSNILKHYQAALVLQDHPWMPMGDEIEKFCDPFTSDFTYIRLLGDRYKIERITDRWDKEVIDRSVNLNRWADLLVGYEQRKLRTYTYINNHYAGHAPATLEKLKQLYLEKLKAQ